MCQDLQFKVPDPWGIIILVCNILCPGFGTLISAYCKEDGFCCMAGLLSWLQAALATIVIGWIRSIWHGYKIYLISNEHGDMAHTMGGNQYNQGPKY